MAITTIEGPFGSGKTLCMTAFVYQEWKDSFTERDTFGKLKWPKGRPIYATYHLNGIPSTFFNLPTMADLLAQADAIGHELDPFAGAIVALDESYLFMDSRRSNSKGNLLFNALLARSRKLEADFFIAVLGMNDIDKRIRKYVTTRCRPKSTRNSWVRVMMRDMRTGQRIRFKFWGPTFYPLYQSGETVPLPKRMTRLSNLDR